MNRTEKLFAELEAKSRTLGEVLLELAWEIEDKCSCGTLADPVEIRQKSDSIIQLLNEIQFDWDRRRNIQLIK